MVSFMVVVVQPWGKGLLAGSVAGEDLPVGPFGLQCAVEPFCFAVGPGAVGSDEDLFGAQGGDDGLEVVGVPVGECVVGHDGMDGVDAQGGEVGGGAGQERGGGGAFLIG